jgi:hypothetical protein
MSFSLNAHMEGREGVVHAISGLVLIHVLVIRNW